MEATQRIRLPLGLVLTPQAIFSETYASRQDELTTSLSTASAITVHDAATGRYQFGGDLRLPTRAGNWDLSHSYIRRMRAGTFSADQGAPDYGIDKNLLSLQDTLRPSRHALLRLESAYDFRVFRDTETTFRRRVNPMTADLVLTPSHNFLLAIRDTYNLQDGNRNFTLQGDWGDRLGTFAGLGVTHVGAGYVAATEFALGTSSAPWRLSGVVRASAQVPGGLGSAYGARVFEKEITVLRRFHDFTTRVILRERPPNVKEFTFRIDMRLGQKTVEEKVVRKDWESEWFPWRKGEENSR